MNAERQHALNIRRTRRSRDESNVTALVDARDNLQSRREVFRHIFCIDVYGMYRRQHARDARLIGVSIDTDAARLADAEFRDRKAEVGCRCILRNLELVRIDRHLGRRKLLVDLLDARIIVAARRDDLLTLELLDEFRRLRLRRCQILHAKDFRRSQRGVFLKIVPIFRIDEFVIERFLGPILTDFQHGPSSLIKLS